MPGAFKRIIWIVLDSVGIGELPDAVIMATSAETHWVTSRNRALYVYRLCGSSASQTSHHLPILRPRKNHSLPTEKAPRTRPAKTPRPDTGKWPASGSPSLPNISSRFSGGNHRRIRKTIGQPDARQQARFRHGNHQGTGEEHVRTGKPIVYTSGDSVFQIAAHEE